MRGIQTIKMSILRFLKLLETWLHNGKKKSLDAWTSLGEDYLLSMLMWKMTLFLSEPSCGHYSWNIGTIQKVAQSMEILSACWNMAVVVHSLRPWHIGLCRDKTATKLLLPTAKSLQPQVSISNLQLQSHDSKGLILHSPAGWPPVALTHMWECWDKSHFYQNIAVQLPFTIPALSWTIILCRNKENEGCYGTLLFCLNKLLFWPSGLWKHIRAVGLSQMWSKTAPEELDPVLLYSLQQGQKPPQQWLHEAREGIPKHC